MCVGTLQCETEGVDVMYWVTCDCWLCFAPSVTVGTMARLDGLIRELSQEEARRLFRTYLLEFAELSSQVHSLKSSRSTAESERDDARGELARVKKTVEVGGTLLAPSTRRSNLH
jgi:hypothetical protein